MKWLQRFRSGNNNLPNDSYRWLREEKVDEWNNWRKEKPDFKPNLQGYCFRGLNLSHINLNEADLRGTTFNNCKLEGANFSGAKAGLKTHWKIIIIAVSFFFTGFSLCLTTLLSSSLLWDFLQSNIPEFIAQFLREENILNFINKIVNQDILINNIFGEVARTFFELLYMTVWLTFTSVILTLVGIVAGLKTKKETRFILFFSIFIGLILEIIFFKILATYPEKFSKYAETAFFLSVVLFIISLPIIWTAFIENLSISLLILFTIWLSSYGITNYLHISLSHGLLLISAFIIIPLFSVIISWEALTNKEVFGMKQFIIFLIAFICKRFQSVSTSFRGSNLDKADFTDAELQFTDLRGQSLLQTKWLNAKNLEQSIVTGTILEKSEVQDLVVNHKWKFSARNRVNLPPGLLNNIYWYQQGEAPKNINLEGVNLIGAKNLQDKNFYNANLMFANLSQANLSGSNLSWTDLTMANLSQANLSKADLRGATLNKTLLNRVNLSRADLSGVKLDGCPYLEDTNLSGADLSYASLKRVNLKQTNLCGADLSGADLVEVDLTGANLSGANLTGANLQGANLNKAILNSAILMNANLENAILIQAQVISTNFTKTRLTGANLEDLRSDNTTKIDEIICEYIYLDSSQEKFELGDSEIASKVLESVIRIEMPSRQIDRAEFENIVEPQVQKLKLQDKQLSTYRQLVYRLRLKLQNITIQKKKILILAAIPRSLRLDKEIRDIEEVIRGSKNRDLFEITFKTAVRPQDIRHAIKYEKPQIVHFCGHGLEDGSLLLEDDGGNDKPISVEGLAFLFQHRAESVECVVLNACYSAKTAIAIGEYVNYVIGMNQAIQDKAAIAFATAFYDELGNAAPDNLDIFQKAFVEGEIAFQLECPSEEQIPLIYSKTNNNN